MPPSFRFINFKIQIKFTWDIPLLLKHLPISHQWNFSLETVLLFNLYFGTLVSWESIREANNNYKVPTFFNISPLCEEIFLISCISYIQELRFHPCIRKYADEVRTSFSFSVSLRSSTTQELECSFRSDTLNGGKNY